jgi:hypothetical protein
MVRVGILKRKRELQEHAVQSAMGVTGGFAIDIHFVEEA